MFTNSTELKFEIFIYNSIAEYTLFPFYAMAGFTFLERQVASSIVAT